jgi:hypothetical protein
MATKSTKSAKASSDHSVPFVLFVAKMTGGCSLAGTISAMVIENYCE